MGVIGIGKKCCWCCTSLAGALRMTHPGISFQIPVSHGFIFPCALPTIGISEPVAKSMETALMNIWYREVGKFAEDSLESGIQSAMSSPAGSISEGVPDPFLTMPKNGGPALQY